ncbi:MAG: galactose-1-phosphate uridylyltransferase [Jiangellales bacterium]
MNIASGHLADGREILFFDRSNVERPIVDSRDLPPVRTSAEIRYDATADEWVAVTAHRQTRTHLPPTQLCPLCPSTADRPTEIPEPDYDVVVFENRFPSFAVQSAQGWEPSSDDPLDQRRPAVGRCEVVCFSPRHDASFADLDIDQARVVVDAWAHRTEELSALPDVALVFCFENRGPEIGVTLPHPHGQIYAYPFVPPATEKMLVAARRHRDRTGGNLFGDVLASELKADVRVVLQSEQWVAFVPVAARWPVEVHLYPRRQVPDLAALSEAERDDLASSYLVLLRALDNLFGVPLPYIAAWYPAPTRTDRDLAWLHLRLMSIRRAPDKLKYLAGSESAMGAFINDIAPEDMAARIRSAIGVDPLATLT